MKFNFSKLLPWLLTACVSGETKVEFTQTLGIHMTDIGRLAVVIEGGFDEKSKDEITRMLKNCPLYSEVKFLETKPLVISNPNDTEPFEQYLSRYAKGSGALLRIRMEHAEVSEESEKSQSFLLFDQLNYDWFPAFGVPRLGTMGFASSMEIGPEIKKRRRTPLVHTSRIQQVYRLSLYHKAQGKILVDRVGKNISELSVFSPDPLYKKSQFESSVRGSLLADIAFTSCPPSVEVTRHLYASSSASNPARIISEGVAIAKEGDWTAASVKWNEALAAEPKNTLANHNLGVFFEHEGNIAEALRHYRLGLKDRRIIEDAFGDIIGRFLPQNEAMEPSIALVTGGNWVFVDVPSGEKRTKASVYRITPIIDPDSSRVIGQTLKEIAVLRFVSSQETRRAARIREYLLELPPRVGDIVVFGEPPSTKLP